MSQMYSHTKRYLYAFEQQVNEKRGLSGGKKKGEGSRCFLSLLFNRRIKRIEIVRSLKKYQERRTRLNL